MSISLDNSYPGATASHSTRRKRKFTFCLMWVMKTHQTRFLMGSFLAANGKSGYKNLLFDQQAHALCVADPKKTIRGTWYLVFRWRPQSSKTLPNQEVSSTSTQVPPTWAMDTGKLDNILDPNSVNRNSLDFYMHPKIRQPPCSQWCQLQMSTSQYSHNHNK